MLNMYLAVYDFTKLMKTWQICNYKSLPFLLANHKQQNEVTVTRHFTIERLATGTQGNSSFGQH